MTARATRKKLSISSIGGRNNGNSSSNNNNNNNNNSNKSGDKENMRGNGKSSGSGGGWGFGRWGTSAKTSSSSLSNTSQASASTQGPPSTAQPVQFLASSASTQAAATPATTITCTNNNAHLRGHAGQGHYHPQAYRSQQRQQQQQPQHLHHHQRHHHHASPAPSHSPPPAVYSPGLNKPVVAFASLSDSNSVSSVSSTSTTASTASSSYGSPTTTTPVSSPASSTSSPTPRSTTTTSATTVSSARAASKKSVYFRSSSTTSNSSNHSHSTPLVPVLSVVPPPGQDGGDGEARRPAMQRVSSFLPSWDKRSSGSRPGFFGWSSNRSSTSISVANPNSLSRINTAAANANGRVQREAFWPSTLDRECEKAARILKSFSTDGYLVPQEEEDESRSPTTEPLSPKRVTKKIPRRIIQNAAGIAIFTCMRSGLWMTGSGGSGILIARKSDGTWSPPSGIMLHTPTLSFIIGVDVYDCVLVVNNLAALESITKPRVTLGEDVGLTSGPLVSLDSDEAHIRWKDLGNTVLTYMKSRGQMQAVNLNGCILAERGNENERFYSTTVTQMDILAGNVARHVEETKPLFEVIKMAEGRTDFDAAVISRIAIECAPGDAMIATPKSSTPASPRTAFGIPNADDPDPFGVLALEMAGLEIREAGSRLRPTSSQFDFNPTPTSPAFSKFNRQSIDTFVSRSNRNSYMSSRTVKSQMTDAGTQTDVGNTPETTPSPGQSEDGHERASRTQIPEVTEEEEEVDYTKVDLTPIRHLSGSHTPISATSHKSTNVVEKDTLKVEPARDDTDRASSNYESDRDDKSSRNADDEDSSDSEVDDDDEEPVVFEVAAVQPARTQAVASRMIHAKGNMVTIPKRIPPPLPMRSPARASRSKSEIGDVTSLRSPLRQAFSEEDMKSDDEKQTKAQSSSYLKPMELKVERIRPTETKAEELKIETPKAEEHKIDEEKSSESEAEFFPAEEVKSVEVQTKDVKAENTKTDDVKLATETKIEADHSNEAKAQASLVESKPESDDAKKSPDVPQAEHSDSSDTVANKHTSSIYTGTTEDRWSFDGSSLTTPTSDRPFSAVDGMTEDETPRKPAREAEHVEVNEKHEELERMGSKDATPSTIAVA